MWYIKVQNGYNSYVDVYLKLKENEQIKTKYLHKRYEMG